MFNINKCHPTGYNRSIGQFNINSEESIISEINNFMANDNYAKQ